MPATTLPGDVKAHLAVPPVGAGPWPGVVVLHESFGLNDDIRQQADRLAAAGYLALAPDLYSAGGAWRCIRATFRALTVGHGKAFDDIEAARTWLAGREDCTGRIGVIGFCMGGGFALLTAASGFAASAPNYAHLPKDLDGVLEGACPVLASYGAKDKTLRGTAAKLEARARAGGRRARRARVPGRRPLVPQPARPRARRGAPARGRDRLPRAVGGARLGADPAFLRRASAHLTVSVRGLRGRSSR